MFTNSEKLPSPLSGYGSREIPDLRSAPVQGITISESSQLSSVSQLRRSHPVSPLRSQIALTQSRDCANVLCNLEIAQTHCAISRLSAQSQDPRILRMRSAISRSHKFLNCKEHIHCFADSLNLCVQEVTKRCELVRNCMEFIFQLAQLIKFSPKRLNLSECVRKEITLSDGESALSPSLRTLCPTQWTARHSAIDSIMKIYQALMSSLQIIEQGHDEYAAKGKGLRMHMESFDTFFSLKLAKLVFSAAEQFPQTFRQRNDRF